jgi:hypothetical protein
MERWYYDTDVVKLKYVEKNLFKYYFGTTNPSLGID